MGSAINDLIDEIKTVSLAHDEVNEFIYGHESEPDNKTPKMKCVLMKDILNFSGKFPRLTTQVDLFVLDHYKVQDKKETDLQVKQEEMLLTANQILQELISRHGTSSNRWFISDQIIQGFVAKDQLNQKYIRAHIQFNVMLNVNCTAGTFDY